MEKLSDELKKYGYVFSWKRSVAFYIVAFGGIFVLGRFFKLKLIAQLIITVAGFAVLPFFLRNVYRNRFFQKQFSDINIYMEQFLYSFQKSGKILTTLEDLLTIFDNGNMRDTIELARDHILHTYNEADVERCALELIEEEYPYEGVATIHNFALTAERLGGDYSSSVMLLLESRRMQADRIYSLQQVQSRKRIEIGLSIITSLLLCSMIYMLSKRLGVDVSENMAGQVVTAIVLVMDMLIFLRADSKLSYAALKNDDGESDEAYIDRYRRIKQYDTKKLFSRIAKNAAIKNLSRDIEKQFPGWLMEVSLLLQTENVAVAIQKSLALAPGALKGPLADLILDLKTYPESIEPYKRFLSDFSLPEVASSMKMLYSISSGTGGDAGSQISDIIRRNQLLFDRAKKLENEDRVAGMYALFLAPQLTGGFKMVVDMILLLVMYMSQQTNL